MSRPLLLGHRGASGHAPENTIEAFDLCLAHGCDGFEFDVRVTQDGVGIVCHDEHFRGMEILSSKLTALAPCSTLNEIIQAYASRAFLNVELKVRGAEEAIVEFAKRYEAKRILISSFLPEVLRIAHSISPALHLGLICADEDQFREWRNLPVEAVIMNHALVSHDRVNEIHAAGKKAWVWTVNEEEMMRRMVDHKLDAIISDNTELLCSVVLGHGKR